VQADQRACIATIAKALHLPQKRSRLNQNGSFISILNIASPVVERGSWRAAGSRARAQYRKVLRKWCIASSSPGLQIFRPTSRRIMIFDPDGEWWHVKARRGHGPHDGVSQ
jgi:hypothetical protein